MNSFVSNELWFFKTFKYVDMKHIKIYQLCVTIEFVKIHDETHTSILCSLSFSTALHNTDDEARQRQDTTATVLETRVATVI